MEIRAKDISGTMRYLFYRMLQAAEMVEKRRRKLRQRYSQARGREEGFNNHYSLGEKAREYQALNDPYTSYYFSNRSVKKHLKELKKAIRFEPNYNEKVKLNHLITKRIKEKFEDFLCPKTSVYEQSILDDEAKKTHQKSNQSISSKKPTNLISPRDKNQPESERSASIKKQQQKLPKLTAQTKHLHSQTQNGKFESSTNRQKNVKNASKASEQKQFADKLAEELHFKKHEKWLSFLEEKKRSLHSKDLSQGDPPIKPNQSDHRP